MPYSQSNRLKKIIYRIIDNISFNDEIRDLADNLNRRVEQFDEITPDLLSHPGGFTRAFYRRRIGIAEAYARIARELDRNNCHKRLHALKSLVELSLHAKTVSMPLNTARVQIQIMKEAINSQGNRRRQFELIADFSLASYGHEAVIRRLLREFRRVEIPEKNRPLKELDMGWDSHVHDNLSEGRKTPSQLILDAFIKGFSRLTLAYYDISEREVIFEAMEAGRILGIDVSVGIEFSVGPARARKHFMYIPPVDSFSSFIEFFDTHKELLSQFIKGLEENKARRRNTIIQILENFNNTHLIRLNERYSRESIFSLRPLQMEALEKIVMGGQYSRVHLGELLYAEFKQVLKRRTLALKVQFEISSQLARQKKITDWEIERIKDSYRDTREQYKSLNPYHLGTEFFSGKSIVDYDSAFALETDILPSLKKTGGSIIYNRPLEHGLSETVSTILNAYQYIDHIELINMQDSATRNPSEIIQLANFTDLINNRNIDELKSFLNDWGICNADEKKLTEAFEHYHKNSLIPLAGSASTGWSPDVPGMGFIKESSIPAKSKKHFVMNHYRIPSQVALQILTKGKRADSQKEDSHEYEIFSLGRVNPFKPNLVGDEEYFEHITFKRLWQYLNPALKNILRVSVGLIPSYLWIGPGYTIIWFGITFFRNIFVDMVASAGTLFKKWTYKDINFDNATQSLFWTGFSVPILVLVKQGFDMIYPFAPDTALFVWSKFFIICITNGLYISIHNKIRRFDNRVIKANFFRSLLAFPFASVFASVGDLFAIPSIVQAKFWSDMVAAVIEGTNKFRQRIVIRERDLLEILPLLGSRDKTVRLTAMLDILYIWARRPRGRTCLARLLVYHKGIFHIFQKLTKPSVPDNEKNSQDSHDARLRLMLQIFNPQWSQPELTNFILERYTSREAVLLTSLLNMSLVDFYMWLKKLK